MSNTQGISQKVAVADPDAPTHVLKPNADGSINIQGSVTAVTAFEPTGNASLSVTTSSDRVALPSVGPTALLTNAGDVPIYVEFGDGSVTATVSDTPISSGQSIAFDVGSATHVAAITGSGTSTLTVTTGTGTPTMAGGGGRAEVGLLNDADVRINPATLEEQQTTNTLLATPATQLPPVAPVGAGNTTFTRGTVNLSAVSGDQPIIAAGGAGTFRRVHGLFLTFSGASAETLVTVKSGATAIGYLRVPATPNQLVVDRRDLDQWLYACGDNEAFIISPAAALNIAGDWMRAT